MPTVFFAIRVPLAAGTVAFPASGLKRKGRLPIERLFSSAGLRLGLYGGRSWNANKHERSKTARRRNAA
jgi:hypothetical protein